jgi:hypothetical protein
MRRKNAFGLPLTLHQAQQIVTPDCHAASSGVRLAAAADRDELLEGRCRQPHTAGATAAVHWRNILGVRWYSLLLLWCGCDAAVGRTSCC